MALVKIYQQESGGGDLSTLDIGRTPITGGSVGCVLFEGTGNLLQESSKFIWDVVNGRLGLGTNTPIGILHLKETAQATRFLMDGDAGQSKIITFRTSGLQRFGLYCNNIAESGSNVGSDFAIRAYSDLGVLLSTPFYIKRSSGNVLVNTTTDSGFKFDVVGGDARINTLTIGLGGGQVSTNIALGLNALGDNTTGYDNTAIGTQALGDNTIGEASTAVGYYALQKNTTGSNNTALGYASLLSNVTTSNHTAIGTSSLRNITSGSYNIAFGVNAGRYIADGTTNLTTCNTSIFIGAISKPLANSQTNQIVIGYNAIGLGSNSVVLGNSSITLTALRGNVLIDTTTDAGYRLDVNGSVRATGSISATSLLARGTYLNQTLVATANNDVLVALDIAPTFTTGAFTGVTSFGIRVTGAVRSSSDIQAGNGTASLSANSLSFNNTSTTARVLASSTTTNLAFRIGSTDYAQFFNTTGNLVLQSGGTFTDAGFKLDVNGTARVQGSIFSQQCYVNVVSTQASAIMQADSTSRGFLPPRMTTTQKNAIASPAVGLVVYDTTLNKLCVYTTAWETITSV